LPGHLQVTQRRLPCALLERVQYIDELREPGDIQHAVLEGRVNSDLTDTGPDGRQRFPIQRVQALLDTPKLNAGESSRGTRKRAYILARGTEPLERLVEHGSIY